MIESNKFYVHPRASSPAGGVGGLAAAAAIAGKMAAARAQASAQAQSGNVRLGQMIFGGAKGHEMPPVVADALRAGFVGPRYKEGEEGRRHPGRHYSQSEGPDVIHLDGVVFIVNRRAEA